MAFQKQYLKSILGVISGAFFLFCSTPNATQDLSKVSEEISQYQIHLTQEYSQPETSPLKEDEIENFKGISFFPIDLQYRVLAAFEKAKGETILKLPTSSQKLKSYKEYGTVLFQINGQSLELKIYQPYPIQTEYAEYLFLPFYDETNGITSYGGGRYLDVQLSDIQHDKFYIDFNKAYNPYCAYSKYYNCPIPPPANRLPIEIPAGVSYAPHE